MDSRDEMPQALASFEDLVRFFAEFEGGERIVVPKSHAERAAEVMREFEATADAGGEDEEDDDEDDDEDEEGEKDGEREDDEDDDDDGGGEPPRS